jgi:spore coat polysaccharide biosynthesis protein SpsF
MLIAIQARSDSKRFPKKIFSKINNKTILENIIQNLKSLNIKICVCSTNRKIDNRIKVISVKNHCIFFAGNKNDVLKRLYDCAKKNKADWLIRVNGDSPLISSHIVTKAIKFKTKFPNYDIITNVYPRTFPKGMSIEIIKTKCLKKLVLMNLSKSNKEHVTEFIYSNPKSFKIKNFKLAKNLSFINLSVDTKNDLNFVKSKERIFKNIKNYQNLTKIFNLL